MALILLLSFKQKHLQAAIEGKCFDSVRCAVMHIVLQHKQEEQKHASEENNLHQELWR